jgi:phage tail tape-measure protein
MARNSFNININLKGFPNANQQLKRTSKGMDEMRVQTTGLVRKIGALRNRILVFTFAIGGATLVINKFVGAAAGFESVKARLVGLTGSVEKADAAFKRFSAVAGTTPFQLQDVVNAGAQLEAFGLNANATLSSVTDLAAFMGTTATEAANALGRAFAGGVGAADMLRDKGIRQIIQDSQGIEDITKLTLPQFRKALISALTDPDGRISGSAERLSNTYEGAVSNMKDALTNFTAMIGGLLLPSLTESVKGAAEFVRAFDKK